MRIKAVGLGAIQASFVVAVGYVSIFLLNVITWAVEQTPGSSFNSVLQTTSRIWLNAQFVALQITEGKVAGIKAPGYEFTLVPLGFSLLIGWAIYRAGKNLRAEESLGFAWTGAILGYLAVAVAVVSGASSKQIYVIDWQGIFVPIALFSSILIVSSITGETEFEPNLRLTIRDRATNLFERLPWAIKPVISPALRAGTMVVASLAAFSALAISLLVALNWIEAVKLYQSLQLSFFGTLTISLGQLALIPNAVIYGMSWLTGTGFSIGQGSIVSPLAVELGPLPAIPMLSALPASSDALMIIFILVPILASFGATLLIKAHTAELRFNYASATTAAIALGVGVGLVAAIEMLILADFASGSIGPARMNMVGINLWLVFAVTFVEVALTSVLAAFFSARPEGVDTELVQRVRRLK